MKPGKRKEDGTYEITYVPSQKPTVDMAKRIEEKSSKRIWKITGDVGITLQGCKKQVKNTIERVRCTAYSCRISTDCKR